MKKIITHPQACDMGDGRGYIEFEPKTTLREVLNWYKANSRTWGECIIKYRDGEVLRRFDYDIYNNTQFYYHLTWELDFVVKEAKFSYCFMAEDLIITLEN